jgi:hypothetical protein
LVAKGRPLDVSYDADGANIPAKAATRRSLQPSPKPLMWGQIDGWTDKMRRRQNQKMGSEGEDNVCRTSRGTDGAVPECSEEL